MTETLWPKNHLSDIAQVIDCKHRTPRYSPKGIALVSPGNIAWGPLNLDQCKRVSKENYSGLMDHCEVHLGDLVLGRNQSFGIASYVATSEPFALGQDTVLIQPRSCAAKYLYYYLQSSDLQLQIARLSSGSTFKRINLADIRRLDVRTPPLPEQRKIAEILTTWDDALALLDRRIDLARDRKKGLMQRLLTGRVRFPEFEGEEWRETRLDKVVERVTRRNSEGCQSVLTMSAQRGLISQTEYYNKRIAAKDVSHYYLLRQGEFAYNKSTSKGYPFGAIKRLDDYAEGVLSTLYVCFRLRDDRRVSSDFLAHYFEGGQLDRGIYSIAQEGARNHGLLNISLADFFALQLRLPSTAEQRRIAEVLQTCDEEIALLERKRELTAQQKKGLMQRLLTGRVRVRAKTES